MIDPFGQGREPASREDEAPASEDHGHHEPHPHEHGPDRLTDHLLALITAVGTVALFVITLLKI